MRTRSICWKFASCVKGDVRSQRLLCGPLDRGDPRDAPETPWRTRKRYSSSFTGGTRKARAKFRSSMSVTSRSLRSIRFTTSRLMTQPIAAVLPARSSWVNPCFSLILATVGPTSFRSVRRSGTYFSGLGMALRADYPASMGLMNGATCRPFCLTGQV